MGKFFMGLLAGIAGTIGTCLVIDKLDSRCKVSGAIVERPLKDDDEDTIPAEAEDSQE